MISSMTGYGRGQAQIEETGCTVEVRSVNHRYCDISSNLPKKLSLLESRVRKKVQDRFARGRFDIFVIVDSFNSSSKELKIDRDLARQYVRELMRLKEELHLSGEVGVETLFQIREILRVEEREEDLEKLWIIIEKALDIALGSVEAMRRNEGKTLQQDILTRIEGVRHSLGSVKRRIPQTVVDYRDRLKERVDKLLDQIEIDPERLAREVVIYADRSDVTEEITRLDSHIEEFLKILQAEEPVGRKLDFLIQEMNREVNTISSKTSDLQISQAIVEIKSELEKIREQIQNIE
ncbi:MAG: YicC family protein [Candidatus Tectomicrobia bacterium]|nr:YicC family protein [Candidatus Tectomicrobia bacterium]